MRPLCIVALLMGCQTTPDGAGAGADAGAGDPMVDGGAALPGAGCEAPTPGRRLLRRLSHREYAHSVFDLLGLEVDPAAAFAADPVVHGFANNAAALKVSALLADQYRAVAEGLAEEVELGRVLPCGGADRPCAIRFVREFGLRVFRRPLTADEEAAYLAFYDEVAAEEGFEAGVRWILTALLQAPQFLYRTELGRADGDGWVLTGFERAAALSFLLWETTPDARLLELAGTGALLDPEVWAGEVERVRADPRTARTAWRFFEGWLGLEQLAVVNRDPEIYPELTTARRHEMRAWTRATVEAAWADGLGLGDLLLHEVPDVPPAAGLGLLAHPALLTTYALAGGSSPIHRGLMVRERLLCQDLPPPPANLDTSPPPVDPTRSARARYTRHSADPACAGCHALIDPIGFAFEHFDGIGRYRETEGPHAIDARGEITGSPGSDGPFDGVAELAWRLAESPDVAACYRLHWVRYGAGDPDAVDAACLAASLGETGRLDGPPLALLEGDHFIRRVGEPGEMDVPGADRVPTEPGGAPPPPEEPPEVDPPLGDGVRLELTVQSRWDTGYCADGEVTHLGAGEVTWTVEADIEGTINDLWNAVSDGDSGRVRFSGMPYNATLGPMQTARFGFCAQL